MALLARPEDETAMTTRISTKLQMVGQRVNTQCYSNKQTNNKKQTILI